MARRAKMKKFLAMLVLSGTFLTGCINTVERPPQLRVTNDVYEWNYDRSTALNIIEGVVDDHKMFDTERPKGKSFSQTAAGQNLNDALDLMVFGMSGLFFDDNSSQWIRPRYIWLEKRTTELPQQNYGDVIKLFVDKLSMSLSHVDGLNIKSYTIYNVYYDHTDATLISFEGEICEKSGRAFDLSKMSEEHKNRLWIGPKEQTGLACSVSTHIGKLNIIKKDGEEYWAYNVRLNFGNKPIRKALFSNARYFDGYAAFPAEFTVLDNGKPSFPVIFEGEKIHYFITPE
jgi:hypothetical protein